MPWIEGSVEILDPSGEGYVEIAFEAEYEFQPAEPAVLDVNSAFAGPGCPASAELLEETIRRIDGRPVTNDLLIEVKAWWRRTGEEQAIEEAEEAHAARRRRRARADPCD